MVRPAGAIRDDAHKGTPESEPEAPAPSYLPPSVWAVPELKELLLELGVKPELKPAPESICFVAPLGAESTASYVCDATR